MLLCEAQDLEPNLFNRDGEAALHLAIVTGDIDIVMVSGCSSCSCVARAIARAVQGRDVCAAGVGEHVGRLSHALWWHTYPLGPTND